jgi:hypothetical protein
VVGLHVAVLTSSARYCRVRVRVLRNARDEDHNRQPDLNRVFLMQSAFSPWSVMARETLRRDYAARRPKGAAPVSPLLAAIEPASPNFGTWLEPGKGDYDLGTVLDEMVRRTVEVKGGGRVNLWNVFELTSADHAVHGAVVQLFSDHHVRYAIDDEPPVDAPEREDYVARQLLGPKPAHQLATFFSSANQLKKDEVRTAFPLLRVLWTGPAGAPMLDVIWPIRWKS